MERREEEKMKSKWTSWRWEHSKAVKVSITVSITVQSMMIMTELTSQLFWLLLDGCAVPRLFSTLLPLTLHWALNAYGVLASCPLHCSFIRALEITRFFI